MIVKIMITIKFNCRSARNTFNKTYITVIITRLLPIILISTLFMKAWRAVYLAFYTVARVVTFKDSLACVLRLRSTIFFITDVLQGQRLFRIHLIDLRITIPAVFSLLEFGILFAIITEMIRCTFTTSTLFCFACTILANKSVVDIMFFLLPENINYFNILNFDKGFPF